MVEMSPQEYILACALKVEKMHGEQGPVYIAARIGEQALKGDANGVAMWKKIAEAYAKLTPPQKQWGKPWH